MSFNLSKRKDPKSVRSFEVLAQNLQKVGLEVVKCDKHSPLVFSIHGTYYLYNVRAQLDRMAYHSQHYTDNESALVRASKNKANPATDEVRVENKSAILTESQCSSP